MNNNDEEQRYGLPLFRGQALEHRRNSIEGKILVRVDAGWTVIGWLVVSLIVGIGVLLLASHFSSKETVRGILVSRPDLIRVRALGAGTIAAVIVEPGTDVHKGQTLFTVFRDSSDNGGAPVADAQLLQLDLAANELNRQKQIENALAEQRISDLNAQIASVQKRLLVLTKSAELQEETNKLLADQVTATETLAAKGFASKVELRRQQADLQSGRIALQTIRAERAAQEGDLNTAKAALEKVPEEMKLALSQIDARLSEINQSRADAIGRSTYTITAPVSGRVDLVQIEVGQQTDAGMVAVTILPANAQLTAELFVPSRAIGFLRPGQRVRIAYDAFPYLQFGFSDGEVMHLSYTLLEAKELPHPVGVEEPVYRVSASIPAAHIESQGRQLPLRAGMALTGDIILERRSLLDWMLGSARRAWARI